MYLTASRPSLANFERHRLRACEGACVGATRTREAHARANLRRTSLAGTRLESPRMVQDWRGWLGGYSDASSLSAPVLGLTMRVSSLRGSFHLA